MAEVESATTLAIAAFTKHLGFAVFRRGELAAFWTKQLPRPRTDNSISAATRSCVAAAIHRYRPSVVLIDAVETDRTKSFGRVIALLEARRVVSNFSVPTRELSFATVKRSVKGPGSLTRAAVLEHILRSYPETRYSVVAQNRNEREYYAAMFAAIAMGHVYNQNGRSS